MYAKTLLCLANSWKTGGRCIAGRELANGRFGGWVRPVSARPTEEVSEEERQFENGRDPRVCDVITVSFEEHVPRHHQVENHRLDPSRYWRFERRASWDEVCAAVERPRALWSNGSSTRAGQNDRVPEHDAVTQGSSLLLVRPEHLAVRTLVPGADFGDFKRKVRARFSYNGVWYDFTVTDPVVMRERLDVPDDHEIAVPNALLCVSLAESYSGFAYKLIATVLTPERAQ